MLSQQCNIECEHCIVESTKEKKPLLNKDLIQSALKNAIEFNISNILLYGGEPFLQYKDLLPYSIEESFKKGFKTVQIGTNGFWGKYDKFRNKFMDEHHNLAEKY